MDEVLALIKCAYPKFTDEQARVYGICLKEIPDEVLKKAVVNVIKQSRFLPTIAEIIEESKLVWQYARGIELPNAEQGWAEVYKAIGAVGPYRKPVFKDPMVQRTVECMGWQSICNMLESDVPRVRDTFLRMYQNNTERKETARRMRTTLADGKVQALVSRTAQHLLPQKVQEKERRKIE